MQSKYYVGGSSCNRCNQKKAADNSCGCTTSKSVPVTTPEWDCDYRYSKGECVGVNHCGGSMFYISKLSNNVGNQPSEENAMWWDGPAESICGLIELLGV